MYTKIRFRCSFARTARLGGGRSIRFSKYAPHDFWAFHLPEYCERLVALTPNEGVM